MTESRKRSTRPAGPLVFLVALGAPLPPAVAAAAHAAVAVPSAQLPASPRFPPKSGGACDEQGPRPSWVAALPLDLDAGAGACPGPAAAFVQLAAASAKARAAAAPGEAAGAPLAGAAPRAAQLAAAADTVGPQPRSLVQVLESQFPGFDGTEKGTAWKGKVPDPEPLEPKKPPKQLDEAVFERTLEREPFKWVIKGNYSAILMRPENETEMKWLARAVQRASMTNFAKEGAAEEVHILARQTILPSVAVIMLSMLVSSYFSSLPYAFTKFVPECLITVMVAGFLGLFVRHLLVWGVFSTNSFELCDASILNLILLPIIIFNGGWSINLPHFSSQFTYCMIFAVGGTIVTIFVVGYANWYIASHMGWDSMTGWRPNFAFAALISATDPVATLCTYAELDIARRQPLLNTLVLAESLLNDAVAIVFFDSLNSMDTPTWHGMHVGIMSRMLILLVGSMIFGILMASVLILMMRFAHLPGQTSMEILYIFMAPFLTFALADAVELSGIIAVLFAGIMMKTYGTQHLTWKGRHLAGEFMEVVAKLADTGVFVLCGTSTALIDSRVGFSLGIVAVALCLVARLASTTVCTVTCNIIKRVRDEKPFITLKHAFMIWLGGLRGGIALVLALELDTHWCSTETKEMIINTTFMVICSLLLICGGTTELFLVALGMVPSPKEGLRKMSFDETDSEASTGNMLKEDSWTSEDEAIKEEHKLLETIKDPTIRRLGMGLHDWFTWMLVGQQVEFERKGSFCRRHS